jgi:hypothetical protein
LGKAKLREPVSKSHSHRGFSPVDQTYTELRKPFSTVSLAGHFKRSEEEKPLKRLQISVVAYHRAKDAV